MINDLKIKLEKFMAAKIPIHIVLKKKSEDNAPRFLNGLLIGKKAEDIFIIDERKLGKTYIFLEDVHDVSVFVKDNKTLAEDFLRKNNIKLGEGVSKDEIDLLGELG